MHRTSKPAAKEIIKTQVLQHRILTRVSVSSDNLHRNPWKSWGEGFGGGRKQSEELVLEEGSEAAGQFLVELLHISTKLPGHRLGSLVGDLLVFSQQNRQDL